LKNILVPPGSKGPGG